MVNCISCGKFIAHREMAQGGGAKVEIVTTIDGDDVEWECFKCVREKALAELTRLGQEMGDYD